MKQLSIILILLTFSANLVISQPVIKAVRIQEPPEIDGRMNDKVWEQASMVEDFYQREPFEGAPASEKTQFFVCYDEHNLYIGSKCWDDPKKITAKELARNASLRYDDRINIILDTYLDKRNAYWFQIGPRGSISDALISENGVAYNREWQGLWTGKAKITDYGWEAEIAIPFKTLSFDKTNTQWGIKFLRMIIDKLERSYWPVANLNTHYFQVSDAGILDGVEDISQGVGLDISPYILTGADTKRGEKSDLKLTGGIDVSYQIMPSLRSMLTINTDFAETEVDERQINLTRFDIHFPEKRNFFLDGANYFYFGIENYSRLNPNGQKIIPFFSRSLGLDENGDPIPVNYGVKLAGQANNWNLGMLYINDQREDNINDFSVMRISRNLWKQSSIGIIGTYGNVINDRSDLVAGADLKLSTSTFQGNKNVSLVFFGLQSNTKDTKEDRSTWGTQFVFPNDFIKARLGYHEIGKNFIAGLGFVPRINIKETYGELEIGPRPNKWGIMQVQSGGTFNYIKNKESGMLETSELKIKPLEIRFLSGEVISYSLINQQENLIADFNIFENFFIPQDNYRWWRNEFKLETRGGRNIRGEGLYSFGNFYNGEREDIEIQLNWKVVVPFFLGGKFIQNHIELSEGSFNANIFELNANVLFSPDITLYNFIQYDNATKNAGWQSRFQWILKPGNEIILAWNSSSLKSGNRFFINESNLRFKIKYNIRF